MRNKIIYILWDSAHIWGLMAWKAMRALQLDCRLVKAIEITQGAILGKLPALLLVPGGNARFKAQALGSRGRNALREWLWAGGTYLGICGGAGFALAQKNRSDGLGICPWQRAPYSRRIYHLLSGHVNARAAGDGLFKAPVWWPGRFAAAGSAGVNILATYDSPTEDLWLADLPFSGIPEQALNNLRVNCGIDPQMDFPAGQPLIIGGSYGKGKYLLSYCHLETPASPQANNFLANLLQEMGVQEISSTLIPAWDTGHDRASLPSSAYMEDIRKIFSRMRDLMNLGAQLGFFFHRTSWLLGWHGGISGMACNNLLAALAILADIAPAPPAQAWWRKIKDDFVTLFDKFIYDARNFLWTMRLGNTLNARFAADFPGLNEESAKIFGHPMLGGGLIQRLVDMADELIFLSRDSAQNDWATKNPGHD